MKCLMRTNKAFTKEAIKRIFNYDIFADGHDPFIARIRVPFDSDLVRKNIDYLNELINDPDFHIEKDCDKVYDFPVLNCLDYYHTIINYKVINKDGKFIREVIIDNNSIEVVTEYAVTVGPFGFVTEDKNIILTELNLGDEADLWDYESIHSLIPNIVDTLINEGYAIVEEMKGDESNE